MKEKKKRSHGLQKRWLINTFGVILALGLVCVAAVTASYAAYYYTNMQADMRHRAQSATSFFSDNSYQNFSEYYQACITYARSYEARDVIELQFIDKNGHLVATSYGLWGDESPETPEISQALSSRTSEPFVGVDPITGEHIISICSPLIYSSGEVVGVLRFVTSTRVVNQQIFYIACISIMVLAVFLLVVLLSGGFFMKSIMVPVAEITEKARRIASGSYGAQIQTRYDDEIRDLADTINEMSTKISQNEKMQAEFISQLSHELRPPLTVINGWSETLLADERMDDETRQGMKIISSEAKRLTGMVTELLDFTRMQDGRMTLNVELTDIRSEFEDTVYMYSSRLAQDGITLEYLENDGDIPEIPCDGQRLRQVFLNVLDNAAKHGRDGKRIEASISYENDQVVVRIRDFGPGIPEDELGLVKKKFYKGSSKARGTGIGLAVCEEIMELHNGSLTLENAPGGGTLVTISLPASQ